MLKKKIPKIVIALTCIMVLLMQYSGTLLAATLSHSDRTAKMLISMFYKGGEESSGTLTEEQMRIYDENAYAYFVGGTRVYKIVNDSEDKFSDSLYCLDASLKFPMDVAQTYTNTGDLKDSPDYRGLSNLLNSLFLKGNTPELKDAYLSKAFSDSDYDLETVKAVLTDDDIDVIQQYAIWHFTNIDNDKYNKLGAIRVANMEDFIGRPNFIVTLEDTKTYRDIDKDKYAHREEMAQHLYNYLINLPEETEVRYPTIDNASEIGKTTVENGYYIAGPFKVNEGNVDKSEYQLKLVDKEGNDISNYTIMDKNKKDIGSDLNNITLGEDFYVKMPGNVSVSGIKLTLDYNTYQTESSVWETNDEGYQPVLLITREKMPVHEEKVVTLIRKGTYSLEILKQDKESKAKLSNAEFNVQIGDGDVITYKTDASGSLKIENIELSKVGTEIIKISEKKAPEGYKVTEGILELEVTTEEKDNAYVVSKIESKNSLDNTTAILENNKIKVTVDNEKITGSYQLQLIKQDSTTKVKLGGAEFNVQIGNGEIKKYTTNELGIISIPAVEIKEVGIDTIKISEVKAPDGYKAIKGTLELEVTKSEQDGNYIASDVKEKNRLSNITTSLTNGKITVIVDNEKQEEKVGSYKLQVIKRDKTTDINLEGADFKIQFEDEEPKIYTTNELGMIEIPEVEITRTGTYKILIEEINAPYGYIASPGVLEMTVTVEKIGDKYVVTKFDSKKTTVDAEAFLKDNTLTVIIRNELLNPPVPEDPEETAKGKYEVEIIKVDQNGKVITEKTATFNVNGKTVTTNNGIAKVAEVDIDKTNAKVIDKYIITEPQAPQGYTKFDGTIEVDVYKALTDDEGSYKASKAGIKVVDKDGNEIERGDKVQIIGENGVIKVKITIINNEMVDLSLRKFITSVSTDEVFDENDNIESREPKVDLEKLDNGESSTAKYNHTKEPVIVKQGNYILYTLRVYNEGKVNGYASQVKDYLPEGLDFVENADANKIWNYDATSRTLTTNENYQAKLLLAHENGKELDYQDLQVICKVNDDIKEDTNIVNLAEITEYKYEDGKPSEDIDSKIENLEYPKDLPNYNGGNDSDTTDEYIPGQEDDDDFERIFVKSIKGKYELDIVKTDKEGKTITDLITKFDINGTEKSTENGIIKFENIEINKTNVGNTDKYTIKEIEAPDEYSKFSGTIEIEITKKLSEDGNSYEVDKATMKVIDSEGNTTETDIEVVTEDGTTKIVVKVVNYEKVDLALRKFIKAVSKDEKFEEEDNVKPSREPKVNLEKLDKGESTTADYEHSKETVKVEKEDYILYTIRVYNEGKVSAYASQVTDYLPEGLEFVKDAEENKIWNYDEETRKLTTNENYKAELLAGHEVGKELAYQDLQVVCRVSKDAKEDTDIMNIAEITDIIYEDGTPAEDRDSTPSNVEPDKYVPGNKEDDDDYEKIMLESIEGKYEFSILKVDQDGKTIKDLVSKFKINDEEKETKDGTIKLSEVKIDKTNFDKTDKYTIKEIESPKGYKKFSGTIEVEVTKKLSKDEKSYEVDKATVKILDSEGNEYKGDKITTVEIKNGKIELKVVNYKEEEPKKPEEPSKPDTPTPQPTPEPPKEQPKEEPKTEPKSEPKTYTPSTGDILPIVTIGLISVVIVANIAQIVISKRKKD